MPKVRVRPPIKITSVTFRGNVEIGKFQHVHVEASASVPSDANPSDVLDELKSFVAQELKRAREGEPVQVAGRFRV